MEHSSGFKNTPFALFHFIPSSIARAFAGSSSNSSMEVFATVSGRERETSRFLAGVLKEVFRKSNISLSLENFPGKGKCRNSFRSAPSRPISALTYTAPSSATANPAALFLKALEEKTLLNKCDPVNLFKGSLPFQHALHRDLPQGNHAVLNGPVLYGGERLSRGYHIPYVVGQVHKLDNRLSSAVSGIVALAAPRAFKKCPVRVFDGVQPSRRQF